MEIKIIEHGKRARGAKGSPAAVVDWVVERSMIVGVMSASGGGKTTGGLGPERGCGKRWWRR